MTLKILKQEKNMKTSEHNNSEIKRFLALNERKKWLKKLCYCHLSVSSVTCTNQSSVLGVD